MIHATAIVHPGARVDPSVRIGPYAIIDEDVEIGPDCVLGPYAYLTGITTIGPENRFYSGCVIGEAPQDLKYRGDATALRIGKGNTFRENVTINRAVKAGDQTIIGCSNLFMANVHVGHDSVIGNEAILANGTAVAGHVAIGDRAFLSANCLVHQFCRVGTLAMMQGGSAVSQDLPPFSIVKNVNELCGLNIVGMRRAGLTSEERLEIKRLYHALFRSKMNLRTAVDNARQEPWGERAKILLEFVASTKRGICIDHGGGSGSEEG